MKSIEITVKVPEKEDIIKNMDSFSDRQIKLFVDDFEGKTKNWSLLRKTDKFDEFYSLKTATVYQIDKGGYYHKIFFIENRPENIAYGLDKETREGRAYCTKCMHLIFYGSDLIGRPMGSCACKEEKK
jgi:hypothetical protein